MEHHEVAELFPAMSEKEFQELKADIAENGVHEPIWLYENKILDGRHRSRACDELGIPAPSRTYDGDDPRAFVVSLNLHRRHLSESQRSMVAARMANRPVGSNQHRSIDLPSQTEAAEQLNVSVPSVKRAKQVLDSGDDTLIAQVDAGEISVNAANTELKRRENKVHREEMAALPVASPEKRYSSIVIDPPWPMEKIEREVAPDQAGFDYPTMSEAELGDLYIPADNDCHMWLWTTHKFLPMALRLLERWSFKYICTFVWHKPGGFQPFGLPQYNCEFALYARRGAPEFIDLKQFPVCFNAPRSGHSAKPQEFYDLIQRVTDGPRIDMFNRRPIEGFDVWGNESAAA